MSSEQSVDHFAAAFTLSIAEGLGITLNRVVIPNEVRDLIQIYRYHETPLP